MMHDQQPLSSLAPSDKSMSQGKNQGWGAVYFFFWFIILTIIIWFILYAVSPTCLQEKDEYDNHTGLVNNGQLLVCAIFIALFIIFLVWAMSGW